MCSIYMHNNKNDIMCSIYVLISNVYYVLNIYA